jgi:hypothetical protein
MAARDPQRSENGTGQVRQTLAASMVLILLLTCVPRPSAGEEAAAGTGQASGVSAVTATAPSSSVSAAGPIDSHISTQIGSSALSRPKLGQAKPAVSGYRRTWHQTVRSGGSGEGARNAIGAVQSDALAARTEATYPRVTPTHGDGKSLTGGEERKVPGITQHSPISSKSAGPLSHDILTNRSAINGTSLKPSGSATGTIGGPHRGITGINGTDVGRRR